MKKPLSIILLVGVMLLFSSFTFGAMTGREAHERYIYPIVRITTTGSSGSGTVIYSNNGVTYVLTNYHVIENAVNIVTKWDSDKQKEVKEEVRSTVYVEIFKYRDLSTPIGTLKVEADVEKYNKAEDMAIVRLRMVESVEYVAILLPRNKIDTLYVMDETVAVGCSLLLPPLPTVGVITRKNVEIDSFPYYMSSSQVIYGNSGGAMFLAKTGELIGIPSRGTVIGWGTPITHMGFFIPIERIYRWLVNVGIMVEKEMEKGVE